MLSVMHYINPEKSGRKETHSPETIGCKMDINQLLFGSS